MIRTIAINEHNELVMNPSFAELAKMQWYWVDFNMPSKEEITVLDSVFHFHPLAIEDCVDRLQRPKLDYYENLSFLVIHALNEETLEAYEVDLFIGEHFLVTFHYEDLKELNYTWELFQQNKEGVHHTAVEVSYTIFDKIVDTFFPIIQRLEDRILTIENLHEMKKAHDSVIHQTFDVRKDLLTIRKTILPMRDLMYRILESKRFIIQEQKRAYFKDIYDHLLKLSEMIESNRELSSDIRDNYISLNSFRMNTIMKTLTVITTIFMPLTFLAGLYGMNFANMPELKWHYGYFIVLGVMIVLGLVMFLWFKYKGWFDDE
ncbi:magnesium/cobalt transporter CorA [Bacillus testis]|uniref:magnesium/cobalt transporter CorA n=1 Tax=Bacillus testis TaxID=1622072 RepID=UPI00067EE53D|nr:magnesium/cobalt transporter CorA [Bacillus testis]